MILLRHGQSWFNLHFGENRRDPGIVDPGLTELGRAQAEAAAAALAAEGVTELIVSPYRRTLETAGIVAGRLGLPIRIEPLVRERFGFVCDVGTGRSELCELWPDHDFGEMEERWWHEGDEPEATLHARCALFRERIAVHPDWRRVAVVTHWGVIRALTGVTVGNCEYLRFDPCA